MRIHPRPDEFKVAGQPGHKVAGQPARPLTQAAEATDPKLEMCSPQCSWAARSTRTGSARASLRMGDRGHPPETDGRRAAAR